RGRRRDPRLRYHARARGRPKRRPLPRPRRARAEGHDRPPPPLGGRVAELISVVIADDHPFVRHGLRTYLGTLDHIEVVGGAGDGAEAVELAARLVPDVVLMDLVMPELDGVEATRRIRESSPATKVIVLTSFDDDERVFPSVKAGAAGYLLKDVRPG